MDPRSTLSADTDNADVSQIVQDFIYCGIATPTDEGSRLQFAVPMVRIILAHRLFTGPSDLPRAQDFESFLEISIRMRPSALREPLSRGQLNSPLYKRAWQMDWYRAASTALHKGYTLSADVGPIFGSTGFLDFYVNNRLEWGVEFLCEGCKMKEHAERFFSVGKYGGIPLNPGSCQNQCATFGMFCTITATTQRT